MPVSPAYDAVVIGSGVGGAFAAHPLVEAGLRVLMLERGGRVTRGPAAWASHSVMTLSPHYSMESPLLVIGDDRKRTGSYHCVGGAAVFYGAVAIRLREVDFEPDAAIVGDSGAGWPFGYAHLEPWYGLAESLLDVAGVADDPTEPFRSTPLPRPPVPLRGPSIRVAAAARALGLTPSTLPLTIGGATEAGAACRLCGTCDGYVCAVSAKAEPSTTLLPRLERAGLTLLTETVALRLLRRGGRVVGVECVDRNTRRHQVVRASHVILAAGALASPLLVLSSGLQAVSPARDWIGRGLMRHCNGIVFGAFAEPLAGGREFHKQLALFDLYGDGRTQAKLGCIQSVHPPPSELMRRALPSSLRSLAEPLADRSTGLLVIAEDQPRFENGVEPHPRLTDRFGMPLGVVAHRHTGRDRQARGTLTCVARAVLRRAGACYTQRVHIRTFSHALGTLRTGNDPRRSPLDASCRFRGLENLWIADASFMPRSGGVNPSLTIAANALRVGTVVVDSETTGPGRTAEHHAWMPSSPQ